MVVAALLLALAMVGVAAHFHPPHRGWVIGVSALAPYLMLAAPIAAIAFVAARQWIGLLVAIAVVAVGIATQAPAYVSATVRSDTTAVVAMTANLRLGEASPTAVVDAVRRHHVELLTVQELTRQEQDRLVAAGLESLLTYRATDPRSDAAGVGVWSAYPLSDVNKRTDFRFAFVTARVALPGVARLPLVAALHLPGPWPQSSSAWLADAARLPAVLRSLAASHPVLVGGDFNATLDVAQFRRLLVDGYQDGAEQAGAGMTRTYPSDTWYPPLIAIDHVLTRDAVASSAETVEISGSDHRALVVTVHVPRGPE